MNALRIRLSTRLVPAIAALAAIVVTPAVAQVPVDDGGAPLADYESFEPDSPAGNEDIPLLTRTELQELVGPIALYPDDLLAIVLPASTYPLQLVQAQRFVEDLEQDPSLKPDEAWDDSVIALLNYPEVLELLNEDLDWTWRLGEAVVAQQTDVVGAVESFRDRAYAAGNLKSDSHQTVARNDGTIEITPVEDDVIYVPYYEPERVVVYQTRPAYHYYPRAYPVYYYPYPVGHAFNSGFFWGVTTAFTVGWVTDSVHVIHHSYHGHPYYDRHYWDGWWYRRPTIHVHNHYYSRDRYSVSRHRYSRGDHWRPRHERRRRLHNQRVAHSSYYTGRSVRHRSYTGTATHATARNMQRTHTARSTDDRRQSHRARSVSDNRRHERQAFVPSATRQAPRRATQRERNSEQPQRARVQRQQARPERNSEQRQRARIHRQQTRPETVARRDHVSAERHSNQRTSEQRRHRASENRQERGASTSRRQEPSQSRQQRSREKPPARTTERKRHASSRDDSKRQRH
ncbi:MAG: DUF3300 domain-containing protein [Gammaproteobacteria bacterium]|jgi:hypothetical protein|nr:DUF3300 domain-containing protein [Gammaproteobacteria bacterium]MDH3758385.1 DUF3300 domain-containing protein [Gammaproteobacteria bacterium]NCF58432.1 DUF3300 domain-containing protein [Gammaproteobacteria bacterium]